VSVTGPADGSGRDWHEWHARYDQPDNPLAQRLLFVQRHIRDALDRAGPGPVRVVSFCTGEGRDLLGVLEDHPRGRDVHARLVELDPTLAARARARAVAIDLPGVEVVTGDASTTTAFDGAVPADVVLVCGVFGNITDDDIANTVRSLPTLCAQRATVIWTRHRRPPDTTPAVRAWFVAAGFHELAFDSPATSFFTVASFRFDGEPRPFVAGERLFTFVGYDALEPT
jgi:hypothetical protein